MKITYEFRPWYTLYMIGLVIIGFYFAGWWGLALVVAASTDIKLNRY